MPYRLKRVSLCFMIHVVCFGLSKYSCFPLCFDMTNIAENATVAQGVAQANAENNSVKTNEVANVSAIDALLQKHSGLIADAHNVQRTIVDWFTPPNDDYSVNTKYQGIAEVNGRNQHMLAVGNTNKLVRLPDDFSAFVGGKQLPSQSFGSCKRLVNILRDYSAYYDKKLSELLSMGYSLYMTSDDYADQKGLIFDKKEKDQYGNQITRKVVWTQDNRNAMQSLVNDVVNYISSCTEHPTIPLVVSARSRAGYSAIIESVE